MLVLIGTILLASILGSVHCAGMCGAFLLFALGTPSDKPSHSKALLQGAYHFGRLITYTAMGVIAGFVGSSVDVGGRWLGIQRGAAIVAGSIMVLAGLIAGLRLLGVKVKLPAGGTRMQKVVAAGHRASSRMPPPARALAIGLLTTLLPCGWLWMFVVWAGGTGSAASGAMVMAAFWTGTVPLLAVIGVGIQKLGPRVRAGLPAVTAMLLIGMGAWTLYGRGAGGHGMGGAKSVEEITKEAGEADHRKAPCCVGEGAATQAVEAKGGEK
jgi:sulfite exporter TauE/SafE